MKIVLGVIAFCLFTAFSITQIYAGFLGIEYHWGKGWAIGAIIAAFVLRIFFPITIGAFFGARDVWEWDWPYALAFAIPGLLVAVPGLAMGTFAFLMSLVRESRPSKSKIETSENFAPTVSKELGATGVGGWLALLVVGLIVFGPVFGGARIAAEIAQLENLRPDLITIAMYLNFKAATWWVFATISLISIVTGLRLYRSRKAAIIWQTILGLWIMGPLGAFVLTVIVPAATMGGRTPAAPEVWGVLFSSAIAPLVWSIYLVKSKRVKYTYIL